MEISSELMKTVLRFQQEEIDSHTIYKEIANLIKDPHDAEVVRKLSAEELCHYKTWSKYSGKELKANGRKVWFYKSVCRLLGYTFVIKLLERGEDKATKTYEALTEVFPEVAEIVRQETEHEEALLGILDEEALRYAGSVVLGLNDALVELTGTLAGLTLAFQNANMIALSGLITGIAAALSMAASEFLSTKSDEGEKDPKKAAIYTGIAYVITVALLITPYLIFKNYYISLGIMLLTGVLVIAFFSYYISVVRDDSFLKRFGSMAGISLGVALISFLIGYLIRRFFGIDI